MNRLILQSLFSCEDWSGKKELNNGILFSFQRSQLWCWRPVELTCHGSVSLGGVQGEGGCGGDLDGGGARLGDRGGAGVAHCGILTRIHIQQRVARPALSTGGVSRYKEIETLIHSAQVRVWWLPASVA